MAGTATEYIQHHLTHLNNIGAKQGSIVDFSVFNFDTAVLYPYDAVGSLAHVQCSQKSDKRRPG
jgi:hypothetical protein